MNYPSYADQEALDFFAANVNNLEPASQKAWGAGELKVIECNHHLNADLTASPVKILKISTNELAGVNTFDKGKTPSLENICLTGLQLGHAKGATADMKLGGEKYSSVVDADIDPAWLNATLIFTHEKKEILRMPVKRFYHAAATDRAAEYEGMNFKNFRLIKADTLLEIEIEYPDDVAINAGAGNSFFVSINFKGAQTTNR